MAKPKCSKCSAMASIGGMCAFHFRESQAVPETEPGPKRETKRPATIQPVSKPATEPADLASECAGPDCSVSIQRAATGRPRRFCSPACRLKAHRAK